MKLKENLSLLALIILFSLQSLSAKNYYLSADGNDNNKGTSQSTAWKSIEKLNTAKIKPGDSILFRCGDTFAGEITISVSGSNKKQIVFSSYGTGSKPVISGAIPVTGWKKQSKNIYTTKQSENIKHLFSDNQLQTSARFPNMGYLFMDSIIKKRIEFFDDALVQKNGYWNGAYIRYRPNDWTTRHGIVESFSDKSIKIKELHSEFNKTSDHIRRGSGYFFDNVKNELDSVSEWYYDSNEKRIYYKPPSDISGSTIEGIIHNNAFTLLPNVINIEISNLRIEKFHHNGINAGKSIRNVRIINNEFVNINSTAIHFSLYAKDCIVKDNYIADVNGRGIIAVESENVTITENTLNNIGLRYGYGISGLNGMTGILVVNGEEEKDKNSPVSKNNHVSYNIIENTGYNGIRLEGINNTVKHNVIVNAMSLLNDGGGIYSWSRGGEYYVSNNIIYGNIIDNICGSKEGVISDFHMQAIAIYLDNRTLNTTVENNIVCNSLKGMFTNTYSENNIFKNNIIYNVNVGFETVDFIDPWHNTYGHVVENNLFFLTKLHQHAVNLVCFSAPSADSIATFIRNKYYSLHNPHFLKEHVEIDNKKTIVKYFYEFDIWQSKKKYDINGFSKLFNHSWKKDKKSQFKTSQIIYNPSNNSLKVDLTGKEYFDLNENKLENNIEISPFGAQILLMKY